MIDRIAQSDRITRIASQWFEMAIEALNEGRKQDATVAILAHGMCMAAHETLVGNAPI